MAVLIIILLTALLVLLGFDYIDILLNWLGRIKIGSVTDKKTWLQSTQAVIIRWLEAGTPKLPVNENKKFRLIAAIKNYKKIESTAYWQDAAILKAADGIDGSDEGVFALLDKYIDTDSGKWRTAPDKIDCAMLAYELLCSEIVDNTSIRPAMDYVADFLYRLYEDNGTIPYNEQVRDVRFVDTIGMVCPFLMKYAVVYNKPEYIDIALEQIKEYRKYGFDKDTRMPCHCFNVRTKAPLGIYGWGRGCAWWALGITDCLKTLMTSKTYNIEKVLLLKYAIEFMSCVKAYQRSDGAFCRMLFTPSLEDSSAGAMLAYCFAVMYDLTENEDYKSSCVRVLEHLKTCTRRNGVIDYAQGDTMGIGFYSDALRVVPATQGFAVIAAKEIEF